MDAILYAEIYLICIVFDAMLLIWAGRSDTRSTSEMWLRRTLMSFLFNFVSNFFFTVFNRIFVIDGAVIPLSYGFKTLYFMTLAIGVFCWCGYAETVRHSPAPEKGSIWLMLKICLAIGLAMPVLNLFTHWMFDFSEDYAYQRHFLFQTELAFLILVSSVCSVRLLEAAKRESAPAHRAHLYLTSTFPLCLLVALILSCAGEAVPVICVCVMVEMLCIYMGTSRYQISTDPLTQVNNRQNLIGFMDYKLKNHTGDLYLLMIDLDGFKSINDTYGHLAGDKALVELSGVLKRACGPVPKRPYIARYGGDEFIVITEGTEADIRSLCESIREGLKEVSGKSDTYQLAVSIGLAKWKDGMDHKALIAAADADLYQHKPRRKV